MFQSIVFQIESVSIDLTSCRQLCKVVGRHAEVSVGMDYRNWLNRTQDRLTDIRHDCAHLLRDLANHQTLLLTRAKSDGLVQGVVTSNTSDTHASPTQLNKSTMTRCRWRYVDGTASASFKKAHTAASGRRLTLRKMFWVFLPYLMALFLAFAFVMCWLLGRTSCHFPQLVHHHGTPI